MPNVIRRDYVAIHAHAAADVQGLPQALFPPPGVTEATVSGPTRSLTAFADLSEMTLTVTPPEGASGEPTPYWEAHIDFTGTFSNANAGQGALVRLTQGVVTVLPNTTRQGTSASGDAPFTIAVKTIVRGLRGGSSYIFRAQWASSQAAAVATAQGVNRMLTVTLRPDSSGIP